MKGMAGDWADDLYAQAAAELDSPARQSGTWARALVSADGDLPKAQARYIGLRVAELESEPQRSGVGAPPLPSSDQMLPTASATLHPWRRFFARLLDIYILSLLAVVVVLWFVKASRPTGSHDTVAYAFVSAIILMIAVEAFCLMAFGTTPGKWLFGIRLSFASARRPSITDALIRCVGVMAQGLAFGMPFVSLVTQMFAYRRLMRTGTTRWDVASRCTVSYSKFGFARVTGCAMVVVALSLFWGVLNTAAQQEWRKYLVDRAEPLVAHAAANSSGASSSSSLLAPSVEPKDASTSATRPTTVWRKDTDAQRDKMQQGGDQSNIVWNKGDKPATMKDLGLVPLTPDELRRLGQPSDPAAYARYLDQVGAAAGTK